MATMSISLMVLLVLLGSAAAQVKPAGPCSGAGSYHLSCYAKSITAAVATAAKVDCFQAWNNAACKASVKATYSKTYGCDTAITYAFANDACRDAYQKQEKTNTKCKVYSSAGLAKDTNRQTATVLSDYKCLSAGPCGKTKGAYHLSCYTSKITRKVATAAKLDCFKAWNKPTCKATVLSTFGPGFGCETGITYFFTTEACRDAYQKQEKTNKSCKLYNSAGLGNKLNRKTATVEGDYTCPIAKLG